MLGGAAGIAYAFKARACRTRSSALLLQPQNMLWNWWDDVTVELRFWLPAGSFATSVVREIMQQDDSDADIAE